MAYWLIICGIFFAGLVAALIGGLVLFRHTKKASESVPQASNHNGTKEQERIRCIHRCIHRSGIWSGPRSEIYAGQQTGVQYLVIQSAYGLAVTPLLEPDGKPLCKRF
jgi:hypothetical protein